MAATFSYAEIRNVVLTFVRDSLRSTNKNHTVTVDLVKRMGDGVRQPNDQDFEVARQVWHDLYFERIITPGVKAGRFDQVTNNLLEWPWFQVGEYGRAVLCSSDPEPYDPEGYLAAFKKRVPDADFDTLRYLDEALACFRANTLLASAVMLGCASENAVLQLVETFGARIVDPNDKKKYDSETSSWMISKKYTALWSRLKADIKSLPSELSDGLERILDNVFDLIRTNRNAAGHPTGRTVSRDEMRAAFIVFPGYCERVFDLIKHFMRP